MCLWQLRLVYLAQSQPCSALCWHRQTAVCCVSPCCTSNCCAKQRYCLLPSASCLLSQVSSALQRIYDWQTGSQILAARAGKLGLGKCFGLNESLHDEPVYATACIGVLNILLCHCWTCVADDAGSAYVHGLTKASGDFTIIMDADLSHHVGPCNAHCMTAW